MNRKQIKRGEVYAWSRARLDGSGDTRPVLVLDTDAEFPTYTYRQIGTHKGILVVFVDELTLADPGEENYIRNATGHLTYGNKVGQVGEAKPANLWRSWAHQVEINAYAEDRDRTMRAAHKRHETAQEKLIAEFYSLIPASAWPAWKLEPGFTPHLTVPELIAIAKGARSQALAETDGQPGDRLK